MTSSQRTIQIAGMGTSPAVLTEMVWALCHCEKATASLKESLVALTAAHTTDDGLCCKRIRKRDSVRFGEGWNYELRVVENQVVAQERSGQCRIEIVRKWKT